MICADCRASWSFREGECEWFQEHGFALPRRCSPCRDRRRAHREAEARLAGTVTEVREDGGGFIRDGRGHEYFFVADRDVTNRATLHPGDTVTFTMGTGQAGPRTRATMVTPA